MIKLQNYWQITNIGNGKNLAEVTKSLNNNQMVIFLAFLHQNILVV